jgi:hypothetical protein
MTCRKSETIGHTDGRVTEGNRHLLSTGDIMVWAVAVPHNFGDAPGRRRLNAPEQRHGGG